MGSLEYLIDWYLTLGELIQFIERLDVDKYPYDLWTTSKRFFTYVVSIGGDDL